MRFRTEDSRLRALEAERGPATIRTLRDYVVWLANCEEGEERPPMDPELEAVLFNFGAGAGREPTAAEAAEAVGMDPKRLGTLLGRAGVKARSVHRGGKKARRYTLDMKEKIEKKS